MHKILVVMDVLEEHKAILNNISSELEINYIHFSKLTAPDVEDAEIIIGNPNPKFLANCKNLKLLQLNSAGTDGYTANGVLPEGTILANLSII